MNAEIISDAQSTITSGIAGALAGTLSNKSADFILDKVGIVKGGGLGDDAITFIVNSFTAAVAFYAATKTVPQSTNNLYFSHIFFTTSDGLTYSTLRVVQRAVDVLLDVAPSAESSDVQSLQALERQVNRGVNYASY